MDEAGEKNALSEQRIFEAALREYFDAGLRFLAKNPLYLRIFTDAALNLAEQLICGISKMRRSFDELNISMLTGLLESAALREGITVAAAVGVTLPLLLIMVSVENIFAAGASVLGTWRESAADLLTINICILLIKPMKRMESGNMAAGERAA